MASPVDDKAGGERDAEEGECVDGEAEDLDEGEGADERDRDGDGGDDGRTPVEQEEEDDDDDDGDGFRQRRHHFLDGVTDDGGRVERYGVLQSRRKTLGEFLERSLGLGVHIERIGVGELQHADALRGEAVVLERGAVILGANFGMAYVAQQDQVGGIVS